MKRPKPKRRRRRQAKANPTNQYIFSQDATAALTSLAGTMENLYLVGVTRIESELHSTAEHLHSIQLELGDISRIGSPIWIIAQTIAQRRPTTSFWQRVWIRLMNWWLWRRPRKAYKTREAITRKALSAWETKANGADPSNEHSRWSAVWK
jgi:hypothetical protein